MFRLLWSLYVLKSGFQNDKIKLTHDVSAEKCIFLFFLHKQTFTKLIQKSKHLDNLTINISFLLILIKYDARTTKIREDDRIKLENLPRNFNVNIQECFRK